MTPCATQQNMAFSSPLHPLLLNKKSIINRSVGGSTEPRNREPGRPDLVAVNQRSDSCGPGGCGGGCGIGAGSTHGHLLQRSVQLHGE